MYADKRNMGLYREEEVQELGFWKMLILFIVGHFRRLFIVK